MKKICRLNILPLIADPENMKIALESAIKNAGISLADIEYVDNKQHSHYGNWVFVPVCENDALRKVVEAFRGREFRQDIKGDLLDFRQTILEPDDMKIFSVGQKVKVNYLGGFCMAVEDTGTIIDKAADGITIRKYRSKRKGWKFKVGDSVTLTPLP